ncbi:hypothetical protein CUJ83_03035 [Methanocella sp. CWC-04]|uniref:histidine kinase n=1 Tax=Methanooceanicella nereidis TaxID=2052831 RepID=A0AAP2RAH6_9EURY|nr:PAS domain S-box protein [Methanocella sp. CWC-04]MCD1293971.1 hypothetical protein [Methanocella sp. CWC-04]
MSPRPSLKGLSDEEKTREELLNELKELRLQMSGRKERGSGQLKYMDMWGDREKEVYTILDMLPAYALIKDPNGVILMANQKFCDALGLSKKFVLGKKLSDILPDYLADKYRLEDEVVLRTGKPLFTEDEFLDQGNRITIDLRKAPLIDDKGNIEGVVSLGFDIITRKKFEEYMRLTQFSIDRAADTILWIKKDGSLFNVNDTATRKLGYTRGELKSMHIWDIDPNFPKDIWPEHWKEVKERGSFKFESAHIRKDGEMIPVEITVNFLNFKGEEYNCAFARDISDRKRAEEVLRAREAMIDSIFRAAPVGIGLVSDRVIKEVNVRLCEMLGYSREELIDRDSLMIYPTFEEYALVGKEKYRQIAEQGTGTMETRWKRKDGTIFNVLLSSTPINPGDISKGVTFTALDITKRKQAEEALRESENKYRNIVETAQEGIWVIDKNDKTVFVNKMMAEMLGYDTGDMIGKTPYFFMDEETAAEARFSIQRRRKGVIERIPNFRYRRKDGSDLLAIVAASPLFDQNGEYTGALAMVTDIRELKRSEDEIKVAKTQAELYMDLMGHDINNMNQAAIGFLELAQEKIELTGILEADDMFLIEKPIEVLKNSSRLIDNVRKVQRETAGEFKPEVMDIGELLDDIKAHYSEVPGRDITINYVPVRSFYVKANELLRDVFSNIVGNAIKHSTGPLIINIVATRENYEGREYYRVTVEDDGPGISDELKKRLFDGLCLVDVRARGKGFGLCLCKMLIDDYNGKFWVEDRVRGDYSRGARFVIMLPAAKEML